MKCRIQVRNILNLIQKLINNCSIKHLINNQFFIEKISFVIQLPLIITFLLGGDDIAADQFCASRRTKSAALPVLNIPSHSSPISLAAPVVKGDKPNLFHGAE